MQCYKKIPIIQKGERYWVPCGKCNFCLQNNRISWAIRMMEEEKVSKSAYFLTLTYDDKNIPHIWDGDTPTGQTTLDKKHLSNFHQSIKRKQKRLLKKSYNDWKIRYFSVGEYGSKTLRPHYHSAIYNVRPEILDAVVLENEVWGKGRIHVGTITDGSANYVAKYMIDRNMIEEKEKEKGWQKPFTVMSRNPGLGYDYVKHNATWHKGKDLYNPDNFRLYMIQNGYKKPLPRYYKNIFFKQIDEKFQDVMKTSLELHYMQLGEEFEKSYIREINRLSKIHPNPEDYYFERIRHQHDQIKIKSLKQNVL